MHHSVYFVIRFISDPQKRHTTARLMGEMPAGQPLKTVSPTELHRAKAKTRSWHSSDALPFGLHRNAQLFTTVKYNKNPTFKNVSLAFLPSNF